MKETDCILILKSLAANLPILHSWGYIFPRMIRVVVEPGVQMRVKDVLTNFIVSEKREDWNSDFHFFVTNSSSKGIVSKEKDAVFERDDEKGVTAVITDNPIADDEEGNYFFVFLEERQYSTNYKIEDIVPYPTDLEAIHTKLIQQEDYELMEEERILRAAVYFLEPYFFRAGELHRVDELLAVVRQMCIIDENVRDTNDMPEMFVRYLFEWQKQTNFAGICDLDASVNIESEFDEVILYDADNIYMAEKMFKKIVQPMRAYVPINSIKKGLRDKGYLIVGRGNSSNTYTTKIDVSSNGKPENRVRVMKFKRELLAVSGGLNFIDVCYFASAGGEVNV